MVVAALPELRQQAVQLADDLGLDLLELDDLGLVLPVMRQVVVIAVHALDLGHGAMVLDHDADHAGRVGLEDQGNHVEEQPDAADQIRLVGDVRGLIKDNRRLRPLEPGAGLAQFLLGRAYRGVIGVEPVLVGGTHAAAEAPTLRQARERPGRVDGDME